MNGILLINKQIGWSSFDIVARLRKVSKTKKIGHCGTLDPLAQGLMLVVFGHFTKISNYLMLNEKEYLAQVHLGFSTNTDDLEGEVVEKKSNFKINHQQIDDVIKSFLGKQLQQPPIFSAISINGQRSYKLARQGTNLDLPKREIEIQQIEMLSLENNKINLLVKCSKGTYIRSLARDIGKKLSIPAHLSKLKRTKCGSYNLDDAKQIDKLQTKEDIEKALLTGCDNIMDINRLAINKNQAIDLGNGKKITCSQATKQPSIACYNNYPIAIVQNCDNEVKVLRGIYSIKDIE